MNDLKCPFCGNRDGTFEVIGTVIIFNSEYKIVACPRCNHQHTVPSWAIKRVTLGEFIAATIFIFLVFIALFLHYNS